MWINAKLLTGELITWQFLQVTRWTCCLVLFQVKSGSKNQDDTDALGFVKLLQSARAQPQMHGRQPMTVQGPSWLNKCNEKARERERENSCNGNYHVSHHKLSLATTRSLYTHQSWLHGRRNCTALLCLWTIQTNYTMPLRHFEASLFSFQSHRGL